MRTQDTEGAQPSCRPYVQNVPGANGEQRLPGRDHTVIVPSNLVNVKPSKGSLNVLRWSRRMLIATASPSRRDCHASDRQCTAAISRPKATLLASLLSSPPTVIGPASKRVS